METKILTTIKKMLGLPDDSDYAYFDQDVMVNINSAFMLLNQLGVGKQGFLLSTGNEEWSEFFEEDDEEKLGMVKQYIYLRVRLGFDPPQNSFLVNSIEKQITEYEWRLNVQAETTI